MVASSATATAVTSARVTHGHPVAQAVCALYVLLVRSLLEGETDRRAVLDGAWRVLRERYLQHALVGHLAALERIESHEGRAGRGFVVDSFWSAWDAFAGAADYRQAIERALRYGHDTDTTACIAGGLAGLYWGLGGIPADWLAGMRGRAIVEPLVERLQRNAGVGVPRS